MCGTFPGWHSTRLLGRFRELEQFSPQDRETVLTLIDAMIVRRKVEGVVQAGQ